MVDSPALPVGQQSAPQASTVLVGKLNSATGTYELVSTDPSKPILKRVHNSSNFCPVPPKKHLQMMSSQGSQNPSRGRQEPRNKFQKSGTGSPVILSFEDEMRQSFKTVMELLQGNEETGVTGLVTRVEDLETEMHGDGDPTKGLVNRVQQLEGKVQPSTINSPSASTSSSHNLSVDSATALKERIAYLEKSNEVLMGISSKLQHRNKSLQNQLYVQKDRQNYLNLHFGIRGQNAFGRSDTLLQRNFKFTTCHRTRFCESVSEVWSQGYRRTN